MALTHCADCGREVSTRARHCVHCGRPWPAPASGTAVLVGAVVALVLAGAAAGAFMLKRDCRSHEIEIRSVPAVPENR